MTTYIIRKSSRTHDPYQGPSCDLAGVPACKVYDNYAEALSDAERLLVVNPIGFIVEKINDADTMNSNLFCNCSNCGHTISEWFTSAGNKLTCYYCGNQEPYHSHEEARAAGAAKPQCKISKTPLKKRRRGDR